MYAKQFLPQIREIMGVLDSKFDSYLPENFASSQNSVIWALIYGIWSVKKTFWKFTFFAHLPLCNAKDYAKMNSSNFGPKYPEMHLRSQKPFFVNLRQ